jgi:hypothetical protein
MNGRHPRPRTRPFAPSVGSRLVARYGGHVTLSGPPPRRFRVALAVGGRRSPLAEVKPTVDTLPWTLADPETRRYIKLARANGLITVLTLIGRTMNKKQTPTLEAGQRVRVFFDANPDTVGVFVTAKQRAELDAHVAALQSFGAEQIEMTAGAKAETARMKAIRAEVHKDFINPVSDIARILSRNAPEFKRLVLPSRIRRAGDFETKAAVFANDLEAHADVLRGYTTAADEVALLRDLLAQFAQSKSTRASNQGREKGATEGIKLADQALRSHLIVMDGTLTPRLRKNQPLLANWNATRRIHKTVVSPRRGGSL